jgi:hypothetical protein
MRVKIHYPAFLRGFPARHRTVKQCLVALPLDVEIQEIERKHAPVAITYSDHANRIVELSEFGGLLYRSLEVEGDWLEALMGSRRIFDVSGEVLGVMAARAFKDYVEVGTDANVLPRKAVLYANQIVVDDYDKDKAFEMGEAFVVSDDDHDRAASYEHMARERMAGFLIVDGVLCYRTAEPTYCATPRTKLGPGKVTIVNQGYAFLPEDPQYVERYPVWSRADAMFFSALSGEEAASRAGLDLDEIPSINVVDASLIRSDFEAMGLERLARNLVNEIGSDTSSMSLQSLSQSIQMALEEYVADDQVQDVLAGLVLDVAALSKSDETMTVARVLRHFTPQIIEGVVERWHDRPVQFKPSGGPVPR